MANFFLDNKDLQFHLNHPLMKKIVELRERGYADKGKYDYAPVDFEDARDSYRRVMEICGEICGDVLAPNAEGVDHDGPRVVDDHVVYAPGTAQNIEALNQAGLFGMTIPRQYGGLNFPLPLFAMANEMSRVPTPDSKTSGACRTAPKPSTNSLRKRSKPDTFPAFAPEKPARWTSPNPMPAATCRL